MAATFFGFENELIIYALSLLLGAARIFGVPAG